MNETWKKSWRKTVERSNFNAHQWKSNEETIEANKENIREEID
ncbi:hypothetical protein [Bacillus sp. NPDC077027]